MTTLEQYDSALRAQGYNTLCGVDEAGRGPLAGPVFAAAVVLPQECQLEGLNDSKKLSERQREALFALICEQAIGYGIGSASVQEIDAYNILQATFLAMRRAYERLNLSVDLALVDGNRNPQLGCETLTVVKGDGRSASIAAASVLAKVARDRYMLQLDEQYPEYQFARHKGYPTKLHYQLLKENGVSECHRRSFLKNLAKHGAE